MRRIFWAVWLMTPVAAAAYHFGPGQERMTLDRAADLMSAASTSAKAAEAASGDEAAARASWSRAIEQYDEALRLLPSDRVAESRRARLESAKAKTHVSRLPAAHAELETLLDEVTADRSADPDLVDDVRAALADAQYYMTWLLRLEGATREEWEPLIEGSRQNWRLLAEEAADAKDAAALDESRRNLESAVRLARMDLQELQGLPLPSQ